MPNAGLDPYACDCGWLERAANDPSVPIGFDAQVNEYYLQAGTPGGVEVRVDVHVREVVVVQPGPAQLLWQCFNAPPPSGP